MTIAFGLLGGSAESVIPPVSHQSEWGYQFAETLEPSILTRNRPYTRLKLQWNSEWKQSEEKSSWQCCEFEGAFRAFLDRDRNDLSIRSLSVSSSSDVVKLKVGIQEVGWGETFGVYIADLVNPRDFSDPFFNELDWIRVPVFLAQAKFFLGDWRFETLWIPSARNPVFPKEGSAFNPWQKTLPGVPIQEPQSFKLSEGLRSEGGLRAGTLMAGGYDFTWLYLFHYNRQPIYRFNQTSSGSLALEPIVRQRVHTTGFSLTKAWDEVVLRKDFLLHFHQPMQTADLTRSRTTTVLQSIIGVDWSPPEGGVFGLQYHHDRWSNHSLHALSIKVQRKFWEALEPSVFVYQGLGNKDIWIQPQLAYYFGQSMSFFIRADLILGGSSSEVLTEGYLTPFKDRDRILSWIKMEF